jgi:DNA-binding MarR family transcriptional regulator
MITNTPGLRSDEFFVLWLLIAQAKDAVSKARHRDLERFNINKERRAILWSVQNDGGESTPVKIARQLFKELHSVSEMLKRMERQELVTISKRAGKSSAIVKLTKKGEEIFNQSRHNEVDKRIFSVLPKKRRERLASDLWAIRNQALRELGIPEWHIKFPSDPNGSSD